MDKKHFITRSKLTIIFICLIILLDQIIKAIAISIGSFPLDPSIVIFLLIRFLVVNREKVEIKASTALSLVLAGGISNLIDRIFRGRSSRLYRHISYY